MAGSSLVQRGIDIILLVFFSLLSVIAPFLDAQNALPRFMYPKFLAHLHASYANHFNDYLFIERPNFFVAFIWMEALVLWPLSVASVYGLVEGKKWFQSTCLILGVSISSCMVAIYGEFIMSGRAPPKLLAIYAPFLGIPLLAIYRGLIPAESKPTSIAARKKMA